MTDLTLIQLISEQTIPNLLPILRLKPSRLVHLVTPKTASRANTLQQAAHCAGIDPILEIIHLSAMPGIPECFNAVSDALGKVPDGAQAVVNFTGGTKLMSIGAFAAAQARKVPSLYVDTQDSCFVDGGTSPQMAELLLGDWSFTPLRNSLRVDTVAIANGVPRVTNGQDWRAMLPLAKRLFENQAEEDAVHAALHGPSGLFPRGNEPRTPQDWLPFFDRPIRLPEPVLSLAIDAGLLRRLSATEAALPDDSRKELDHLANHRVPDYTARYFKAIAPLQQSVGFLTGGWWEVIVMDAAHQSGRFRDLRWSVQVGDRSGPDMEEDIVGLDGVEMLYVSCKRGGAKSRLLPLLEETRARAASLGGSFNRRFLAVLNPPAGRVEANLRQRARDLGIKIITGNDVYRAGAFDR